MQPDDANDGASFSGLPILPTSKIGSEDPDTHPLLISPSNE
jgi:hypothetical protein